MVKRSEIVLQLKKLVQNCQQVKNNITVKETITEWLTDQK